MLVWCCGKKLWPKICLPWLMEIEDLTLADLKFAHPTIIDADIGCKKKILKVFFLAKSSRYRYCTVQSNTFLEAAIGRILRRAALPHWTDCSAQLRSLTILTMKEKSQKMLSCLTMQITGMKTLRLLQATSSSQLWVLSFVAQSLFRDEI